MRPFICFAALLLLSFCTKKDKIIAEKNFHIIATIDKNMDGKMAYLKTQENGQVIVIDSSNFKKNKIEFKGMIDKPVVYGIFINELDGAIGLFMENEIITVDAYKDSLESSKIKGSKTNDAYLKFIEESNAISSKMNTLFPIFQKARAENDVKTLDEINAKMRVINNENSRFAYNYAKQNPESYIAAFALHSIATVPYISKDSIASVYKSFSEYVKKGDFAMKVSESLKTQTAIDSLQN